MKRVTSLLGVFLLLAVLAGCGGSSTTTTPPPPPPPTPSEFLYVSGSVGELFGFSVDPNSGTLSPIRSGHPMDAGIGGLVRVVPDPNGTNLYVSRAALDGQSNLDVLFWRAATATHDAGDLGTWSDLTQALTIPPGKLGLDTSAKNLYVIPDPSANVNEVLSFSITPGTPLPGSANGEIEEAEYCTNCLASCRTRRVYLRYTSQMLLKSHAFS